MKNILILLLLYLPIISYSKSNAVDSFDYPQIGKPCPDFKLNNVEYYPKSTVTLSDFKGKWLILDFWTESCVSCIESFPKLNAIQEEFKDDIQILLLGKPREDPQKIRNLYEAHRMQKNLKLAVVYEKALSEAFGIQANPFIVIIDPKGIVRHITYGFNEGNIAELLSSGTTIVPKAYTKFDISIQDSYDKETPLLINGNGGDQSSYLFRSVLTEYNELQSLLHNTIGMTEKLEMVGFDLNALYKYAFGGFTTSIHPSEINLYGHFWHQLIFETADSTIFKGDYAIRKNLFSYSAHVSDRYLKLFGNKEFDFREVLQNDLIACFPYRVCIEKRMMPCNYLVVNDVDLSKLKTKAKKYKFEWISAKGAGFSAQNLPILDLRSSLVTALGHPIDDIPLLYEGKDVLIDIVIKSIYFEDRLKELNKLGFSVVRGEKEMDVIIVKDK